MESTLDDITLACIMRLHDTINEAYNAIGDNQEIIDRLLKCKSQIHIVISHYTIYSYKQLSTIEGLKSRVEDLLLEKAKMKS